MNKFTEHIIINKLVFGFLSIFSSSVFAAAYDIPDGSYMLPPIPIRSTEHCGTVVSIHRNETEIHKFTDGETPRTFIAYDGMGNKGNFEDALHIERLTNCDEKNRGEERFLLFTAFKDSTGGNGKEFSIGETTKSLLVVQEISFIDLNGVKAYQIEKVYFGKKDITVSRGVRFRSNPDASSVHFSTCFRTQPDNGNLGLDSSSYDQLSKLSFFWQQLSQSGNLKSSISKHKDKCQEVVRFAMETTRESICLLSYLRPDLQLPDGLIPQPKARTLSKYDYGIDFRYMDYYIKEKQAVALGLLCFVDPQRGEMIRAEKEKNKKKEEEARKANKVKKMESVYRNWLLEFAGYKDDDELQDS